ncbi:NUDIX hydrolase [Nesterenkonia alba]|uniref:NUDIX hydrolase n=1 Tax=Nesterenkonia alba TaxID=515814 RepID=UPI0003B53415|nr:NUDIX hydrolase [Nesterenkonia alba]
MSETHPAPPVPRRRTQSFADLGTTAEVLAAGAVCWRLHKGQLQVLVIHRPRYDDWSFPKGKLDEDETLPECAVREVAEEVRLKVRLGMPLPITRYEVTREGRTQSKEVWYWAAEPLSGKPKPDGEETDDVRWVTPAEARQLLSNPGDLAPLDEVERLHEERRLRTVPFIVLRHAKAKPRSSWSKPESERPLAATGKRQAKSIERLLTAWRPRQLHCSPWKRCAETIAPYVKKHRHRIKYRKSLNEKRARQDPGKTARRVRKALEWVAPSLVCTHRPVLPIVLNTLAQWAVPSEITDTLPEEDPFLAPGAVVVAHQAADRSGEIIAFEVYEPFDD